MRKRIAFFESPLKIAPVRYNSVGMERNATINDDDNENENAPSEEQEKEYIYTKANVLCVHLYIVHVDIVFMLYCHPKCR